MLIISLQLSTKATKYRRLRLFQQGISFEQLMSSKLMDTVLILATITPLSYGLYILLAEPVMQVTVHEQSLTSHNITHYQVNCKSIFYRGCAFILISLSITLLSDILKVTSANTADSNSYIFFSENASTKYQVYIFLIKWAMY